MQDKIGSLSIVATAFMKAGKELGYKIIDDNGPSKIGGTLIGTTLIEI